MRQVNGRDYVQVYDSVDLNGLEQGVETLLFQTADYAWNLYQWAMTIHVAFSTDGHAPKSVHYVGRAVDWDWTKDGVSVPLLQQATIADLFPWVGKGHYPDWNSPGLHRDKRSVGVSGEGIAWVQSGGEYIYANNDPERYVELMAVEKK